MGRCVASPVPIYCGDNSLLLKYLCKHTDPISCDDEIANKFAAESSFHIESALNHVSKEARDKQPYLCDVVHQRTSSESGDGQLPHSIIISPYIFTVIDDDTTFTSTWEIASLRVRHMHVHSLNIDASLKDENDMMAIKRTRLIDLIHGGRSRSHQQSVLIISISHIDIHWRNNLLNTSGIQRSMLMINDFLYEHVEVPGGYGKVILIAPCPSMRHDETTTEVSRSNLAKYILALKHYCNTLNSSSSSSSSSYSCSVMDMMPKIWGKKGIFQPYVNWILLPDENEFNPQRMFGIMLEELRYTLKASWCVDDDVKGITSFFIRNCSLSFAVSVSVKMCDL
jgi:hypothetical protein